MRLLRWTLSSLIVTLLLTSSSLSGGKDKYIQKILGRWTVEEVGKPKTRKEIIIEIVNDTIQLRVLDEYGNYEVSSMRFPSSPVKSGPKGLLFAKDSVYVDDDGDTVDVSMWMKYQNIDKSSLDLSVGQSERLRTERYGSRDTWPTDVRETLDDKIRSLIYGSYSVDLTLRRQKKK